MRPLERQDTTVRWNGDMVTVEFADNEPVQVPATGYVIITRDNLQVRVERHTSRGAAEDAARQIYAAHQAAHVVTSVLGVERTQGCYGQIGSAQRSRRKPSARTTRYR